MSSFASQRFHGPVLYPVQFHICFVLVSHFFPMSPPVAVRIFFELCTHTSPVDRHFTTAVGGCLDDDPRTSTPFCSRGLPHCYSARQSINQSRPFSVCKQQREAAVLKFASVLTSS